MDAIYIEDGSTDSSETLVRNYQITRRLIPEDSNQWNTQSYINSVVDTVSCNGRPRLCAIRQFYLKDRRICQNSLLISQSGRHFDAEREIIMEEKDSQ
jgi:hypothetical protein